MASHSDEPPRGAFPRLPGEALLLGLNPTATPQEIAHDLEWRLGDRPDLPPLLLVMLRILSSKPNASKAPPEWARAVSMDPRAAADFEIWANLAGLSLGSDDPRTGDAAAFTDRRDGGRRVHSDEVEQRAFVVCKAAVQADLDRWGENAVAALERVQREWRTYRADRSVAADEARAAIEARFLARARWPFASALWWVTYRTLNEAITGPQAFRNQGLGDARSNWLLSRQFIESSSVREPDAWALLLQACAREDGVRVFGVRNAEEERVLPHVIETWDDDTSARFRLTGELADGAVWGGICWSNLQVDRASLIAAFPFGKEGAAAAAAARTLFQCVGVPTPETTGNRKKGGRPPHARNRAKEAIVALGGAEKWVTYADVCRYLKEKKLRPVSEDSFARGREEIEQEMKPQN